MPEENPRGRVRIGYWLMLLAGTALGGTGFWAAADYLHSKPAEARHQTATTRPSPESYYDLLAMSPTELEKVDVATINLLCSKGLPGAENLDIPAALARLDEWAQKVRFETERHLYRINDPKFADHYAHSETRLRAEFIVHVLQEDCGVHYNMARANEPDYRNSQDIFLHGMINSTNGGTCASMPVMYVAVGRRLSYPMKLVAAKEHLFCRWEGNERLNIEGATNGGVNYYEDDYYRKWPKPISDAEMATGQFLKSMKPSDELADFLLLRGICSHHNNQLVEARASFAEAHKLQPQSANMFTALRVVCGANRQPVQAPNPGAEAWLRSQTQDPDDPTPRVTMPGPNPTFGANYPGLQNTGTQNPGAPRAGFPSPPPGVR